ncbi:MAG: hypothetical protein ABSC37_00930 [Xanthobacteraceae bacterium]|jgi:hypothetical protein
MALPGWNSVETTGFLHDFFELGGIILFLVVVGFELLAYFYGHRKDDLVAAKAQQTEQNHQAAEDRRKAEVEGLQKQLVEADKKVRELDRLRQPRHLTDEQKAKLTKFIRENSKGSTSFTIKAQASESDARAYADEIASFFNAAPINWRVTVDNAVIMGPDTSGIWISIKDGRAIPQAAGFLEAALTDAGLPIKKDAKIDPGMSSPDEIWLSVGNRK